MGTNSSRASKEHSKATAKNTQQNNQSLFFQPKLTINPPNDVYEQEADAMADKVIQEKETPAEKKFFSPPVIQRKCSHCEEEEREKKLQKKEINNDKIIQRQEGHETEQNNTFQLPSFSPKLRPPLAPPLQLRPPFDSIDYLGLHETFFNRGALFPGSYMDAARQEWARQYLFYRQVGLGNAVGNSFIGDTLRFFGVKPPGGDWNAWLSNTTTPLSVDSALSRDFPNFNEQEERRGGLPAPTIIHAPALHFKKASDDTSTDVSAETESYLNNLRGGEPLSKKEKTFFEPKIDADFSDVRIHNDSAANASAKNLNALAYTQGNNIVFGPGQYQPETDDGKKLIAHELTHVIQQNGAVQRKTTPAVSIEEDLKAKLQTGNYASAYLQLNDFLDWNGITAKKTWLKDHAEIRYMFLRSLPSTVIAEVYSAEELALKPRSETFAMIDCWHQTEPDKQLLYAQNLPLFDHLVQSISPYTGENITTVVSRLTGIIPTKSYANYAVNPEFHTISLLAPTIDRKIKFYAQYDGLFKVVSKKFDPFTGTSKEVFEYLTDTNDVDKERAIGMYETLKKLPEEQRNAFLETAAFAGMLEADKDAQKFYSKKYKAQYKALPHNWDFALLPWNWNAPFAERLTVDHTALMSSMLTYEYKSTRGFGFDVGIDSSLDKDKGQVQSDTARLIVQMNDENNFNDPDRLRILLAIAVRGGAALRDTVIKQVLLPKQNAKAISADSLKVIESFGFVAANQFKYVEDKPIARDHNDRLILYAIGTLFKGSTKILGEQRVTVDLLKIQESKYALGSLGGLRLAKSGPGDDYYNTTWLDQKVNQYGSDTLKKNIQELKAGDRTGKLFVSVREDVRQANIYASSLPIEGLNYFSAGTLYRSGPGTLQGIAINISWAKDTNESDNKLDLVVGIENIQLSDFQMVAPKSTLAIGSIAMKGMRLKIDRTNLNDPKLIFGGARLTVEALGLIPNVLTLLPYAVMTMTEEFKGAKTHVYKDKLGALMQADFSSIQSALSFTSLQVKNLYDTTAGFLDDFSIEKRDEQGRLIRQQLTVQETNLWTIDASQHIKARIKTIDDKVRKEKAEIVNTIIDVDDKENRDLDKQIEKLETEKKQLLDIVSAKSLKYENRDAEMKRLREIYADLPALTKKLDDLFDKAKVDNPLYSPLAFATLSTEKAALQKDLDYLDNKYLEDKKTAEGDKEGIDRFEARQRKADFEAKYKSADVTIKLRGITVKGGNYLRDMLNDTLKSMGFQDPTLKGLENIEIGAVDSAFVASGKGVTNQSKKPGVSVRDIHIPFITAPKLAYKTESMLLEAGQPMLEHVVVSVAINFAENPLDKGVGASYKWELADLTVAKATFNGLTVKMGKLEPLLDFPATTPVTAWGFHLWNYDPEKGNINLSINDVQAQGVYADSDAAAKTSKKIGFGIDTVIGHKPGENDKPAIEINYDNKDQTVITKVNIPSVWIPSIDIQSPTLSVSSLAKDANAVELKNIQADVKILLEKLQIPGADKGRPMSFEINNLHVGEINAQGIKLIMREDPNKADNDFEAKPKPKPAKQTVQEVTLPKDDKVFIKDINVSGLRVTLAEEGTTLSTLNKDPEAGKDAPGVNASVSVGKTNLGGIGYNEKTAKGSVLKAIAIHSGKFDALSLNALGRNGREYSIKEFFKFFGRTRLEGLDVSASYNDGKVSGSASVKGKKNVPISIDYHEPTEEGKPGYYSMRLALSRMNLPALHIMQGDHEIIVPKPADKLYTSNLSDVDVKLRAYVTIGENDKVDYEIYLDSLDVAQLEVFGLEYHNKKKGIDVVFDKKSGLYIPNIKAGGFRLSSTKGFGVFGKAGGWANIAEGTSTITASFDSIKAALENGEILASQNPAIPGPALDIDIASMGFALDNEDNMTVTLNGVRGGLPLFTLTQTDPITGIKTTTTVKTKNKTLSADRVVLKLNADKSKELDVTGLAAGNIGFGTIDTKDGAKLSGTSILLPETKGVGADSVNVKLNADNSKDITLRSIYAGNLHLENITWGATGKSKIEINLPDPDNVLIEAVHIHIDPEGNKKIVIERPTFRKFNLRMPSPEKPGDYISIVCDLTVEGNIDMGDGNFAALTVGPPYDAFVLNVPDSVPVQVNNLHLEYKDTTASAQKGSSSSNELTADQKRLLELEKAKDDAYENAINTGSTIGDGEHEIPNPDWPDAVKAYQDAVAAYDAQKAKMIGAAKAEAAASMTKKYLDAVQGTIHANLLAYNKAYNLNIETYKGDKYVQINDELAKNLMPMINSAVSWTGDAAFWQSKEMKKIGESLKRWYTNLAPGMRNLIDKIADGRALEAVTDVIRELEVSTGPTDDDPNMFGLNFNIENSIIFDILPYDHFSVALCEMKYKHPDKADYFNIFGLIENFGYVSPAIVTRAGQANSDILKRMASIPQSELEDLGISQAVKILVGYITGNISRETANMVKGVKRNITGVDVQADISLMPQQVITELLKEKKKGSFTFDKGKQSIDDVHISGKYKQGSDPEATGSVGAGPKGKDNIIIPGATYLSEDKRTKVSYNELEITPVSISYENDVLQVLNKSILLKGLKVAVLKK